MNDKISKKAKLDIDDEFTYNIRDSLKIFPFQEVGVKFITKNNGNCLIADQMGLGKTIQTLVYLYNNKNKLPVLIITPTIAILNWYRETLKWIDLDENEMFVIKGKNVKYNNFIPEKRLIYFINYAIIEARLNELLDIGFKQLVLDESHYIKNNTSKITKSALKLAKEIRSTICLSGTPNLFVK